jgi:RHS repeat-associated protein
VGYAAQENGATDGSTSGFTYDVTPESNLFIYDPDVTGAMTPTGGESPAGWSVATGALIEATGPSSSSSVTTDSTWDLVTGGSIPLNVNDATTSGSSTTNVSYIYGDLLFGGTAPIEQITTTSSGATAVFLVANQTGVQGVFSSSGATDELAVYSPYGKQTIKSGSDVTPFGFQGSYTDSTGLIYLINRYYDPTTDQFLSVDPDVATTDQPYVFTDDDPLNAEDPLGLCWICGVFSSAVRTIAKAAVILTAATVVATIDISDGFDPADLAANIAIGSLANGLVYNLSSGSHTKAGQETAAEDGAAFGAAAYFVPVVAGVAVVSVPVANTLAGSGENVVQYLQSTNHPTVGGVTKAAVVGAAQGATIDKLVRILKK